MRHLPIFLNLDGRRVIVSGAGACAVAKLRLLLKTDARITVFGEQPDAQVLTWAAAGQLIHIPRALALGDGICVVLV